MSEKALDIVTLGEPLIELNRQADGRWLEGFGGDTSNVAVAAARQGARAGVIARVGSDEFGDALRRLWAAEGVAAHVEIDRDAPTGIYFVNHGAEGHTFSYRRAGSAASLMQPSDVPADVIRGARVLHLSAISQAISATATDACFAAIRIARKAGVAVSYDTNLRLRLWPLDRARATINAAAALADILRPGLDDARQLTGLTEPRDILEFYAALGPRIVAMTLGQDGAVVLADGRFIEMPAFPVTPVDASGAGDCFTGAFLARWLREGDAADAARYASCAAGLKVGGYGAIAPIPHAAEVEAALANS